MEEHFFNRLCYSQSFAHEMIVPGIGAIGTSCADYVGDVGGMKMSFVESFATGSYGEGNAVFEEDGTKFGDCGGAVHVGHGMVDGTDCRASFNAGEIVDCADFFHSGVGC